MLTVQARESTQAAHLGNIVFDTLPYPPRSIKTEVSFKSPYRELQSKAKSLRREKEQ